MSYFIPDPRWEYPLLAPGEKPRWPVDVDLSNEFSEDLVFATNCESLTPIDIVSKKRATLESAGTLAVTFGTGKEGTHLDCTRDANASKEILFDGLDLGPPMDTSKLAYTVVFLARAATSGLDYRAVANLDTVGRSATDRLIFYLPETNAAMQMRINNGQDPAAANNSVIAGAWHIYTYSLYKFSPFGANNDGFKFYRGGKLITTIENKVITASTALTQVTLAMNNTWPEESFEGQISHMGIWNGPKWSDEKHARLADDLFQYMLPE